MTGDGIAPVTPQDLPTMLDILDEARLRIRANGSDQWPNRFDESRVARDVDEGSAYFVLVDGQPVATFILNNRADLHFWTPTEAAEPARYLSKLATRSGHPGLGSAVLDWCSWKAAHDGAEVVRLDAWRTNTALHTYYLRNGFHHVRTVERPGRNSGALFERPARDVITSAMRRFVLTPLSVDAGAKSG